MNFAIDNPVNRLLLERGMNQTELAREIGVTRAHLCNVINGRYVSFPVRYKLSKYFHKPVNDLFPEDAA